MARLPAGADAHGVVHLATYQRDGKLSDNPLCWVMRKLPLLLIVRRDKRAVPTCLWCVALQHRPR